MRTRDAWHPDKMVPERPARLSWVLAAVLVAASGCQGAEHPVPQESSPAPSVAVSTSPSSGDSQSDEREGRASGATLWAQFFFTDESGVRAGTEIKIVWRMTGAGDLSMSATGPDGRVITPAWGPLPHGDSSWSRPGDEWGTGWLFPKPGPWTVHATRAGGGTGDLTVQVT
jgi:hypothetical protein